MTERASQWILVAIALAALATGGARSTAATSPLRSMEFRNVHLGPGAYR